MKKIGFFNVKRLYIDNCSCNNLDKIIFKGDGGILTKSEHINKEKYSYTHKKEADYLSLFIKKKIKENIEDTLIIDGTTSLGGNLISFLEHFKYIIGIELNNIRFNKLINILKEKKKINLIKKDRENIYYNNNIILINDSFNNYIKMFNNYSKKNKVIYLDPPWGGKDYKYYKKIILGLAGEPLHILVKRIKDINKEIIVILKLPKNYYLESFLNEIKELKEMDKFYYIYL